MCVSSAHVMGVNIWHLAVNVKILAPPLNWLKVFVVQNC
uniref:Uncharacterized protein n=1 Tax=Anguilla anguilla TaxID=7936 RepID=A0A0E9RNQ7_ANGAN